MLASRFDTLQRRRWTRWSTGVQGPDISHWGCRKASGWDGGLRAQRLENLQPKGAGSKLKHRRDISTSAEPLADSGGHSEGTHGLTWLVIE